MKAATVTLLCLLLIPAPHSRACTLWSAAGAEWVQGGGTLIAKNRDWAPDHRQVLRAVRPASGYRYYGIFAVGGEAPGLKAGINERGLTVVSSTAGSLPRTKRDEPDRTRGLLARLLRECDSVDAALRKSSLFVGPRNLMLADSRQVAVVEIGRRGEYAVRESRQGFLAQTNHYRAASLLSANERVGSSSDRRLRRIEALLQARERPWALADFAALSDDRQGGPDHAIWRTGGTPTRERTLSAWIVHTPPAGPARLHVRIANPQEEETLHRLAAEELFPEIAGREGAVAPAP